MINSAEQEKINCRGKITVGSTKQSNRNDEIRDITNIFLKHDREALPFGPHNDFDRKYGGWYYEYTGFYIPQYIAYPEWFAMLCGRSLDYFHNHKIFEFSNEKNREAFLNRDYFTARSNVEKLMETYNFTDQETNIVRGFFDAKWNLYSKATPVLSLIPKKYRNGPVYPEFTEYWERVSRDLENPGLHFINVIFQKGSEGMGYEEVPADEIIFVDLTKAYPELSRKQDEKERARE